MEKKKRSLKVPHTYVLLFAMVVICALMTWLIPAGSYDRVIDEATGKEVVDAASVSYTHLAAS